MQVHSATTGLTTTRQPCVQLGNAGERVLTPEERIALLGNEWALMRIEKHTVGDYLALADQLKNTPGADLLADVRQPP